MNATLWVIWLSMLTLFGSTGLAIGGRWLVSQCLLDDTWQDGYEQGQDDERTSFAPAPPPRHRRPDPFPREPIYDELVREMAMA